MMKRRFVAISVFVTLVIVALLSVLFGLWFSGGIPIVVGFALLIFIWAAQGGQMEGNPYKRMSHTPVPNFIEVKDYMRKEDIETGQKHDIDLAFVFFGLGIILIAVGFIIVFLL